MTSSTWKKTPLGEQLTFQRGFDITKKEQEDGPYPVVSSSGVKSFHKTFKVSGPGVVIGRKGTLGTAFHLQDDFWPHDTTLWVKDFHNNDPKFAYFFVQCMGFEQYDCGASNPTLNRNHIHNLPVSFPPIRAQRKIASILSAYDDLVENNTRRIAILEEMAQAIYREWFVNFRFPGHENVKLVDSPLGMIPEGWEAVVGDYGKVVTGKTPTKTRPEYFAGEIPFVKTPDMHGNLFCISTSETLSEYGMLSQPSQTVPENAICISCIGTVGAISITTSKCQTNQQINTIIPRFPDWREFIVLSLKNSVSRLKQMGAAGATMDNISKGKLVDFKVLLPEKTVLTQFSSYTSDLFDRVKLLQVQSSNLRTTRDLLLPKLISGELDVEDLDVDTGFAADDLHEVTA